MATPPTSSGHSARSQHTVTARSQHGHGTASDRMTHQNDSPYRCAECTVTFATLGQLGTHHEKFCPFRGTKPGTRADVETDRTQKK